MQTPASLPCSSVASHQLEARTYVGSPATLLGPEPAILNLASVEGAPGMTGETTCTHLSCCLARCSDKVAIGVGRYSSELRI